MPLWRSRQFKPHLVGASPTFQLEMRASIAFNAKDWPKAERLYSEVLAKGDHDAQVVARNMLGHVYERQQRVQDAIVMYEANVGERSNLGFPYQRLAVIYHRLGQLADERRIVETAIQVLPEAGREWHIARLNKLGS